MGAGDIVVEGKVTLTTAEPLGRLLSLLTLKVSCRKRRVGGPVEIAGIDRRAGKHQTRPCGSMDGHCLSATHSNFTRSK
jgi:hypothetical protein